MSVLSSALEGARLLVGAGDLLAPGVLTPGRPFPAALYRVLGVRQVAQALLVGRVLGHRASAGVDALHAVSMVAIALASRRYRTAAVAQVGLASAFAVGEATGRG